MRELRAGRWGQERKEPGGGWERVQERRGGQTCCALQSTPGGSVRAGKGQPIYTGPTMEGPSLPPHPRTRKRHQGLLH